MLAWDPTDDDIEELVIDALEALPAPFRDQLGSVAIVIEDEATPGQLESVGARGLYGLYQGIPRTRLSADAAPRSRPISTGRFGRRWSRSHASGSPPPPSSGPP